MALRGHQVRVNADPQIHNGAKYDVVVDVIVEAIYHTSNPINTIRQIVSEVQSQSNERPLNMIATSSRAIKNSSFHFCLRESSPRRGHQRVRYPAEMASVAL